MTKYLPLIFISLLFLSACGNGTTIANNPSDKITIGKLNSESKAIITIPLSLFGDDENDLNGATIDISVNNIALVSGLDPTDYFNSSKQVVEFILSDLADDDELSFLITKKDSSTKTFTGTVSDTAASEATESSTSTTARLANTICDKLTECNPSLTASDCQEGVLGDDQLSNQFGGPETDGSGTPFSDLENLIDDGSVTVNNSDLESCINILENLACSSDEVTGAWDSSDPTTFSNVENMITPSCETVFSS